MRRKEMVEMIKKVSHGLITNFLDFMVFYFYFTDAWMGKTKTSRGVWEAFREAEEAFNQYKYGTFRQDFCRLKKKNIIHTYYKDDKLSVEITEQGRKRLERLIPTYQEKRVWDKKIYLITYDIWEKRRTDRDLLRIYLKKIGCGMLQESVWITCYNPRKILSDFAKERSLEGQILVSTLDKDGAIGNYDLKYLWEKVFHLSRLDGEYKKFINKYKNLNRFSEDKKKKMIWQMRLDFLNILKDDPQLPFELLPSDFYGQKAYKLFSLYTT